MKMVFITNNDGSHTLKPGTYAEVLEGQPLPRVSSQEMIILVLGEAKGGADFDIQILRAKDYMPADE